MLLFGAFLVLMVNLRGVVDRLAGDVEVAAFLHDDAPVAESLELRDAIQALESVEAVKYFSKEDALLEFERQYPDEAALIEVLDDNPLPASLEVRLAAGYRDAAEAKAVVDVLEESSYVAEVTYGKEWIERFSSFLALLRALGIALATLLVLAVVLIVSNTIKLSVYARRDELEIMRLVGATNFFIRAPYLIEGTLQGGLGSAAAVIGLWALFHGLGGQATGQLVPVLGIQAVVFLPGFYILAILGGGLAMGLFGSLFSVGRFLRA